MNIYPYNPLTLYFISDSTISGWIWATFGQVIQHPEPFAMELFALECVRAQGRPRVCETASTAYLVPHGYGCCDSPKFMNL